MTTAVYEHESIPADLKARFASFWSGYTQAIGFTSMVDDEELSGKSLFDGCGDFDSNYPDCVGEWFPLLDDRERAELLEDAAGFFMETRELYSEYDDNRAGTDFHLTRNRHGSGFWDGFWRGNTAKTLTDAAHNYGTCELMGSRDDDGELTTAYIVH